jgi:TonB family protein
MLASSSLIPSVLSRNFPELSKLNLTKEMLGSMTKQSSSLAALLLIFTMGMAAAQNAPVTSPSERKVATRVAPVYPELAKKMHIRGIVRVEAVVKPNGAVKSARILGGNPVLLEAAKDAVTKWKFETAQSETTEVVQLSFEDQRGDQ